MWDFIQTFAEVFWGIKIGFLLCTEIRFTQYTRKYGLDGIDLLLTPRATGKSSSDQWIRCGQTSAVIGGCYSLSSNRSGIGDNHFNWGASISTTYKHMGCRIGYNNFNWGGTAWISQPGDGSLLGVTSDDSPFSTIDIDLEKAKLAKKEYPLYVKEI